MLENRSPRLPINLATGATGPITLSPSENLRMCSDVCVGRWDILRLLAAPDWQKKKKTLARSRSTNATHIVHRMTSGHLVTGAAMTRILDCTS